jgi:hypothetical protein
VDPETWFDELVAQLPTPATDVGRDSLVLDEAERAALLDLARVAAHTSERWTAPLSTFLVGVAYAHASPDERRIAVRALIGALEPSGDT